MRMLSHTMPRMAKIQNHSQICPDLFVTLTLIVCLILRKFILYQLHLMWTQKGNSCKFEYGLEFVHSCWTELDVINLLAINGIHTPPMEEISAALWYQISNFLCGGMWIVSGTTCDKLSYCYASIDVTDKG